MRQMTLKTVLLAIFVLFFSSVLFAATSTDKYQVKLIKFELFNSGTGEWVTVFNGGESSPSGTLDLAAASGSGQTAGNFMTGLTVPDGSYTRARATPSTSFVIRGIVNSAGTDYYTTSTPVSDGNGRTASTVSGTGPAQDCTVTALASDMTPNSAGITFTGGAVTVTNGVPDKKIKVFFNLSNCLSLGPGNTVIYPGPPTVTMTTE